MSTVTKQVVKYAILPQFIPRLRALFTNMFAHTAFLVATIYGTLGLLPSTHPYLNQQNFGRFGLRHVVSEAANNLVISKKNIDQVIVFFTVLIGLVLLFTQFALLLLTFITQPALAAAGASATLDFGNLMKVDSFFSPPADHPAQDLAFIILDKVFGLEGIFNSCVSTAVNCLGLDGQPLTTTAPPPYPMPMHLALHAMLQFYSLGIFIVSVIIIIYYIIAITAETAATGSPFGQRANKTWVPIRLIVFAALLLPLNIGGDNAGLNGAQLITFWAAKSGSNFATNGWGYFNQNLTDAYIDGIGGGAEGQGTLAGDSKDLIATPNIPDVKTLAQFIYTAQVCKIAEELTYNDYHRNGDELDGIQPYIVRSKDVAGDGLPNRILLATTDFSQAMQFSNYGTINIAFGTDRTDVDPDEKLIQGHPGKIFPYCGSLRFQVVSVDAPGAPQSGANAIQALYFDMVKAMWEDQTMNYSALCTVTGIHQLWLNSGCPDVADKAFTVDILTRFEDSIRTNLQAMIDLEVGQGWDINGTLQSKGWVGAALWYNRIAELNGEIANVVQNTPKPKDYPHVLEVVKGVRGASNDLNDVLSIFDPILPDDQKINFRREGDEQIAPIMYKAYTLWDDSERLQTNIFVDIINAIFGTSAIFDMRRNTDIHPLAQLSALGKSMMEASVRNVAFGLPAEVVLHSANSFPGQLAKSAGSFLKTLGTTTLAMSFVMYYVLPFLPFIYFIFAVSGWVKSIFEAVVAMPLWALAHIRIDGEGLPGQAASNGYFLILEIFLRPILILFGLLASISIFSAMVSVMNDGLFDLIVQNVTGFDHKADMEGISGVDIAFYRAPIDQFFFTAMYVIIVYMIGLSCFKLIDLIPNAILRWSGVAAATIQENAGDPAGQVIQKTYSGGLLATNQVEGGALAALG